MKLLKLRLTVLSVASIVLFSSLSASYANEITANEIYQKRSVRAKRALEDYKNDDKTYFQGNYRLKEDSYDIYNLTSVDYFATYRMCFDDASCNENSYPLVLVKDNVYAVKTESAEKERVGIRIIPVADAHNNGPRDDSQNYTIMDQHLRNIYYGDIDSEKDIFAIISYMHPEKNISNFDNAPYDLRTEQGITHMGAYIGNGETRNSPLNYHRQSWMVSGYPAHVYTISLKGVDQEILNKNLTISMRILNETNGGVKFPINYKRDHFLTFNLEEIFAFYRGWIDKEYVRPDINKLVGVDEDKPFYELIREDNRFASYCAEHITIAINTGLNIVHTEESYQEIWGNEDGSKLFASANDLWKEMTGEDIPQEMLSSFNSPLWKRNYNKLNSPVIDNEEFLKRQDFLAWRLEKSSDLVWDFIIQYADFTKVGVVRSALAMFGFQKEFSERSGIDAQIYMEKIAFPAIKTMMENDVRLLSANKKLSLLPVEQKELVLEAYFSGMIDAFNTYLAPISEPAAEAMVNLAEGIKANSDFFVNDPATPASVRPYAESLNMSGWLDAINLSHEETRMTAEIAAFVRFRVDMNKPLENGMSLMDIMLEASNVENIFDKNQLQYYSPPAIVHRIVTGVLPNALHSDLLIQAVGTAFDKSEIEEKPELYDSSTDNLSEIIDKIENHNNTNY